MPDRSSPADSATASGAPPVSDEAPTPSTTRGTNASHRRVKVVYDQGWLASILRPTLLALMVACLNLALLTFLRRFIPQLGAPYAVSLACMGTTAAVVGSTTTAWLAQPNQRLRRSAVYRLAELSLLLLVTRLLVWMTTNTLPDLRTMITRPLSSLFDGLFLIGATIVVVSWVIATEMSRDLLDMALQPDELQLVEPDSEQARDGMRAASIDRRLLMSSFVVRWVIGGLILILLAAGATVDFDTRALAGLTQLHIPGGIVAAIVVYFLAGLLLISQGQLAILRARWTLEQSPSDEAVVQQWPLYVGTLILIVGTVAALMPLGGTFWLSRIITVLIAGIYLLFMLIFQLLSGLFILLLSLLPFGDETAPPPPERAPPQAADLAPTPPPAFLEWASGATFWIIAAVLLGYLAVIYFSDKDVRPTWLTWLWAVLRARWTVARNTWRDWQATRLRASDSVDTDADTNRAHRRRLWPWRRHTNPDVRVRALYLGTLEAAAEAGIPRRQAETPKTFAPRLATPLEEPEAAEAIHALTDAFVDVRYAQGHAGADDVSRLEAHWTRLRTQLRKR